jgi:peptidoglycan hydrolase CwlO-like protein
MTTTAETDIKELKELILNLDKRFNELDKKNEVQGVKLDVINQRLDDLKEQIGRQDNRFWGLVVALFVVLLGIIGKVLFFPSQPIG